MFPMQNIIKLITQVWRMKIMDTSSPAVATYFGWLMDGGGLDNYTCSDIDDIMGFYFI